MNLRSALRWHREQVVILSRAGKDKQARRHAERVPVLNKLGELRRELKQERKS